MTQNWRVICQIDVFFSQKNDAKIKKKKNLLFFELFTKN